MVHVTFTYAQATVSNTHPFRMLGRQTTRQARTCSSCPTLPSSAPMRALAQALATPCTSGIASRVPFVFDRQISTYSRRRALTRTAVSAQAQPQEHGAQSFMVTTPLYYVNAAPHMGSAYPTIAADVVARYQRLLGKRVHFVTGTDEHGEKIAAAAAARGMTPQAHCDDIVSSYKDLWAKMDISYDSFIRTTQARHEALVKQVLDRVWEKGDIYKADYEGWYCVDCEEFKDEKEMDEGHNCPTHRKPCQHRKEGNYFFRVSRYQAEIEQLLTRGSGEDSFVQPVSRRNELLTWVREGVRDFSISRTAVQWGIPVPRDPAQTIYVWFDALIGYLSGLLPEEGVAAPFDTAQKSGWPASVHIIGKDILRFHAIYWPGMLLSAGLDLPHKVFGHGFLTKDGLKMGKSLGNTLDPQALVSMYGPDAVRFFFMRDIVFGQDGDFSEPRFREIVNAALANNLGNMLNRTLNLLQKNCGGEIVMDTASVPEDHPLRAIARERIADAADAYGRLSFHEALEAIMAICSRGNLLLEEAQPWTALKKGTDVEKAAAAEQLCIVLEGVRIAAIALSPVTPRLAKAVLQQLGYSEEQIAALRWSDTAWGGLRKGHATAAPQPVFTRLEDPDAPSPEAIKAALKAQQAANKAAKEQAKAAARQKQQKSSKGSSAGQPTQQQQQEAKPVARESAAAH